MTDGAARLLEVNGTDKQRSEIYSRLTSRDPAIFFTSGQWVCCLSVSLSLSGL
jgi:hypothetical protein